MSTKLRTSSMSSGGLGKMSQLARQPSLLCFVDGTRVVGHERDDKVAGPDAAQKACPV